MLSVPGLPFLLVAAPAERWRVDDAGIVRASAAPHSDIFIDPGDTAGFNAGSVLNAATCVGAPPDGDFQFSARASVEFTSTYDAGVLLLWAGERQWGKLCFEFSPAGEPMIVSVVCRGVADDANAFVVPGRSVWLRVSRIGRAYAYHASLDGAYWQLIRFFNLHEDTAGDQIGFEAQSPTGDGCAVTFDEIRFVGTRLAELRDGS